MAEFGIPYMGSKDGIADEIVRIFPRATHFYDLFGGGFSITHAMMVKRKKDFKHFHFNEIKEDIVSLIRRAIAGEYSYSVFKPRWISREDFFRNLNDPYIRCCWSFGNNQKYYLFSKEIEPYKKSMHNAIVFNEFDDFAKQIFNHDGFKDGYTIPQRRLFLRARIEYYRIHGLNLEGQQLEQLEQLEQLQRLERLQRLQQLQQLERLQRLEQLQHLEQLERLNLYSKSYENIEIFDDSIVYCDPPYKGTSDYGNEFNTEAFLDWAHKQKEPVFISEYDISDKRFKCIKQIEKRSKLSANKDKCKFVLEKIYLNKAGQDKFL